MHDAMPLLFSILWLQCIQCSSVLLPQLHAFNGLVLTSDLLWKTDVVLSSSSSVKYAAARGLMNQL
jgi:hypothetical protein